MIHPEAKTDWKDFDLDTDTGRRGLERWMAEQLGFWVYSYDKGPPGSEYYSLMEPDSFNAVDFADGHHDTEAEAWADVPHWTENLELAMLFVEDVIGLKELSLNYSTRGYGWIAAIGKPDALLFVENEPTYLHPATAVIIALCQWQEARNNGTTG